MHYIMFYWYRDHQYGNIQEGEYHTDSLTDVFAFGDMVKRLGGRATCNIGSRNSRGRE